MKIDEILCQHRRDFTARFICEHCGYTVVRSGYDDSYFHNTVIPDMECPECGKKAPATYRPLAPKYQDGFQI
jgi:predicted RNA-binding Zn-ribbon protein involved in translation (DUF1610 family)